MNSSLNNLSEQEVRIFTGQNADYYLQKWRKALAGGNSAGCFNWAAACWTGYWLAYRKLYAFAAVYCGIILVETLAERVEMFGPVIGGLIYIIAIVLCGAFGNQWYLSHTRKEIAAVRTLALREDEYLQTLSHRGGTSSTAPVVMTALFIAAWFTVLFVLKLNFTRE